MTTLAKYHFCQDCGYAAPANEFQHFEGMRNHPARCPICMSEQLHRHVLELNEHDFNRENGE